MEKHGFSVAGARDFLKVYDATITYAGLSDSDKGKVSGDGNGSETPLPPEPEIGDLVQVEIGGALQLEKPMRIRAIQEHDGQKWAFIEGSEAGIPMNQIIIEKTGGKSPPPGGTPPRLPEEKQQQLQPGMKEEKNSLDEGEAILTWPEILSADSVRDLEYWLTGVLNKAKRRAGIN